MDGNSEHAYDRHAMPAHADGHAARATQYARERTPGELKTAGEELAIAKAQAPAGGLAAALIAAYVQAVGSECDARAWQATP
ncbi:MAG TPA: hypothetical protein VN969_22820 [Streptosporangiaceae bacterium]|nr:hypothetical protein [Streptosporangiaceae bacterium]